MTMSLIDFIIQATKAENEVASQNLAIDGALKQTIYTTIAKL